MRISQYGVDLLKRFEGVRLKAYRDAAGVWTIGYGHTAGVRAGMRISMDEAERFLRGDVAEFERCIIDAVNIQLSQSQFDALVSFAFNVGCGAFRRSTMRRKLNSGDRDGASREFGRWVNAGGRKLSGLVRRREAERALFVDGIVA